MTVIITMAGVGRRFQEAGFDQPKYEIEVAGRSLFNWAVSSLQSFVDAGWPFVFVARAGQGTAEFITREATCLGIKEPKIKLLNAPTTGQAATLLEARDCLVSPKSPILVHNVDTHVSPNALNPDDIEGTGWIPCFKALGDHWSFVRATEGLQAVEVREKQRISDWASVGIYYFSTFAGFANAYQKYYCSGSGARLEKETYIAPLYNELISEGGPVYVHPLDGSEVICLGTPEEVAAFKAPRPHMSRQRKI